MNKYIANINITEELWFNIDRREYRGGCFHRDISPAILASYGSDGYRNHIDKRNYYRKYGPVYFSHSGDENY